MGITSYYCPTSVDLNLQGNNFADNLSYFELIFTKWSGTDSKGNACQSDSAINTALDSSSLAIAMVNTYYDFDDYNSPVKTYLDDRFYYDFIGGYYKEADIYIQENSVEQKDSFFRYSPSGDESSFICMYLLLIF